ncbi:MAG: DUF5343 domain-containing protein, partial [Mesotoga sp.]|nr:DUF5343 domain-containing protein [Mesotoga sp.]
NNEPKAEAKTADKSESKERREIKGNLPYTSYPGSLKAVLDAIIVAERPDKFSNNFLETVLKLSGGGARSVPPLMKKMGFLEGDGTPTDRYSRFKTESKRAQAASEGLKAAFSELFRRNEFVDKATEDQVKDIIVEITGLNKNDQIIRLIFNTFDVVRSYIPASMRGQGKTDTSKEEEKVDQGHEEHADPGGAALKRLGISYQINVVLPETDNPMVFDAIFKSLKRNLL